MTHWTWRDTLTLALFYVAIAEALGIIVLLAYLLQ